MGWRILALVALAVVVVETAPHYAPNQFLGTCLTDDWVAGVEQRLGVSSTQRDDATKKLVNPFLHPALLRSRYKVKDPRTENASAYDASCMPEADVIYGHGAVVDEATGAVLDVGQTAGSLVVEMHNWASHRLTAEVFAILAEEVLGYNVSFYYSDDFLALEQRMTEDNQQAKCTPTHVDLASPSELSFKRFDWYTVGSVGFSKVNGIWTTTDLVADGINASKYETPFYADFWRDYTSNDHLIAALAESNLRNNPKYFPPRGMFCFEHVMGCHDQCSKTYACTLREEQGKECLVVAIASFRDVYGYWPSLLSNLGFPAYFCFIGQDGLKEFVVDMQQSNRGVLFYMNQPNDFLSRYPGVFQRVSLPKTSPEGVAKNTWQFGENGYGQPNDNPIAVEYPEDVQQKVCALSIQHDVANGPVMTLLARFRMVEMYISDLLKSYAVVSDRASSQPAVSIDPDFTTACTWVRDNYEVWSRWLDRLPECTVKEHMVHTISGCNTSSHREITFQWRQPDPANSSIPYECDGGVLELPPVFQTSRSCEWLERNERVWGEWVTTLPTCDDTFYRFQALECERTSERHIRFDWMLPDPTDLSRSLECSDGVLPDTLRVDCDYLPVQSNGFAVTFGLVMIVLAGVLVSMVLVFKHRNAPIIRRSQFEFLETMLTGAVLMCVAAVIYAGQPTDALCAARPASLSVGITLIFGSLTVKCLRVYRVFLSKKLTRVVLPTKTMFKILGAFLLIDALVIMVWFIVDFPSAVEIEIVVNEIRPGATISAIECNSSSFIFSALLIFWKAILLGAGLYLSFLIRNVSVDFQESIWMFSSSLVVAFGCLMVLPLAYVVKLPATTFYYYFAATLGVCTTAIVALMLVPKFLRFREVSASTATAGARTHESRDSVVGSTIHTQGESTTVLAHLKARQMPVSRPDNYRVAPSTREEPR